MDGLSRSSYTQTGQSNTLLYVPFQNKYTSSKKLKSTYNYLVGTYMCIYIYSLLIKMTELQTVHWELYKDKYLKASRKWSDMISN